MGAASGAAGVLREQVFQTDAPSEAIGHGVGGAIAVELNRMFGGVAFPATTGVSRKPLGLEQLGWAAALGRDFRFRGIPTAGQKTAPGGKNSGRTLTSRVVR